MSNLIVLIVIYLGVGLSSLADNVRGAVYPAILSDLQIDPALGGILFSAATLAALILNTLYYFVPKVMRLWFLYPLGQLMASISLMVMAHSKTYQSYSILIAGGFLLGIGFGTMGTTMNMVVANCCPSIDRRSKLLGLHSLYGLGSLSAPLIYRQWYLSTTGWSHYLEHISIAIVLASLISIIVLYRKRLDPVLFSFELNDRVEIKKIFPFVLFTGIYIGAEILTSSRLVYFWEDQGMTSREATLFFSYFFLLLMIGRIALAFTFKKSHTCAIIQSSFIASFIIFVLGVWIHPKLLVFLGLTFAPIFPCVIDLVIEKFPKSSVSATAQVLLGVGLGLTIMHTLFGQWVSVAGLSTAFKGIGVILLTAWIYGRKKVFLKAGAD